MKEKTREGKEREDLRRGKEGRTKKKTVGKEKRGNMGLGKTGKQRRFQEKHREGEQDKEEESEGIC